MKKKEYIGAADVLCWHYVGLCVNNHMECLALYNARDCYASLPTHLPIKAL